MDTKNKFEKQQELYDCWERLTESEKRKKEAILEEENATIEYIEKGKYYFNRSRKEAIIQKAIEMELPSADIMILQMHNEKWESGMISIDSILLFQEYEKNLFKYEEPKKGLIKRIYEYIYSEFYEGDVKK